MDAVGYGLRLMRSVYLQLRPNCHPAGSASWELGVIKIMDLTISSVNCIINREIVEN
jgi:hypothetical protein